MEEILTQNTLQDCAKIIAHDSNPGLKWESVTGEEEMGLVRRRMREFNHTDKADAEEAVVPIKDISSSIKGNLYEVGE